MCIVLVPQMQNLVQIQVPVPQVLNLVQIQVSVPQVKILSEGFPGFASHFCLRLRS